jgi:hypothetical protein
MVIWALIEKPAIALAGLATILSGLLIYTLITRVQSHQKQVGPISESSPRS